VAIKLSLEWMVYNIALHNNIESVELVTYSPSKFDYDKDRTVEPYDFIGQVIPIDVADLTDQTFEGYAKLHCQEQYPLLGITSRAHLRDGRQTNIFFLDFDCKKSEENLQEIRDFLASKRLNAGYIVDSGNSYHFYYKNAVTKDSWKSLLDVAIDCDLLDLNWEIFQTMREYAILRVSTSEEKLHLPRVIEEL
jgi:hypothetical protein